MEKERIDVLVVKLGLATSREEAKRFIMAGKIYSGTERVDKPGTKYPIDADIVLKGEQSRYVGRGALKLEKALAVFPVSLQDKVVIDVGASTGGFTDCALQAGARIVYSVDVGYNQLAWKLRQDPRVRVMERVNFRHAQGNLFDPRPEIGVMDVSFISMTKLLPKLKEVLLPGSSFIGLIKPQFEAGPDKVGKGGIVRDPLVHQEVLHRVVAALTAEGFAVCGVIPSPIRGGDGNIEYLAWSVLMQGEPCAFTVVTEEDLDEQVRLAQQMDNSHKL